MQAKNYAAQCAKDISAKNYIKLFKEQFSVSNNFDSFLSGLSKKITECTSFNMPENGLIFGKENLKINDMYIPFDEFCISTYHNEGYLGNAKSLIFISKNTWFDFNGVERIYAFFFGSNLNMWALMPFYAIIKNFENIKVYEMGEKTEDKGKLQSMAQVSADLILILKELINALSCRNVEQTIIQKCDAALNARRINKGKLPLYEERILTIKLNAKQGTGTRTGTHESPRQHLRRGHIRRLETGNIWVNACVVGDSSKGVIKKSYNVVA
jgi:hypothetical protein